jgi:acetyl-CoA carboxylase alpha subunit
MISFKEPLGGAHTDPEKMAKTLKSHIKSELAELSTMDVDERIIADELKSTHKWVEYHYCEFMLNPEE